MLTAMMIRDGLIYAFMLIVMSVWVMRIYLKKKRPVQATVVFVVTALILTLMGVDAYLVSNLHRPIPLEKASTQLEVDSSTAKPNN